MQTKRTGCHGVWLSKGLIHLQIRQVALPWVPCSIFKQDDLPSCFVFQIWNFIFVLDIRPNTFRWHYPRFRVPYSNKIPLPCVPISKSKILCHVCVSQIRINTPSDLSFWPSGWSGIFSFKQTIKWKVKVVQICKEVIVIFFFSLNKQINKNKTNKQKQNNSTKVLQIFREVIAIFFFSLNIQNKCKQKQNK